EPARQAAEERLEPRDAHARLVALEEGVVAQRGRAAAARRGERREEVLRRLAAQREDPLEVRGERREVAPLARAAPGRDRRGLGRGRLAHEPLGERDRAV